MVKMRFLMGESGIGPSIVRRAPGSGKASPARDEGEQGLEGQFGHRSPWPGREGVEVLLKSASCRLAVRMCVGKPRLAGQAHRGERPPLGARNG